MNSLDAASSRPWIRTLIFFSFILLSSYWFRAADYDLFARVAVGRLITLYHSIPLQDPFAYTPTKNVWVDHEWLSGLIFYHLSQNGGSLILFVANLGLALLTIHLLVNAQQAQYPNSKAGFVLLLLAIPPSSFIWNGVMRAQAFTFLFFALELLILVKQRKSAAVNMWGLALLLTIFPAWVNLHGGFVVGLGYLGLGGLGIAASNRIRGSILGLLTLGATMSVLINPYGWKYVAFMCDAISMSRPAITEWARTDLSVSNTILFLFGALMLWSLVSSARNKVPPEGWLILFASFIFALMHKRLVPFYLFTACVYLPSSIEDGASKLTGWMTTRIRNLYRAASFVGLSWLACGAVALLHITWHHSTFDLDYSRFPVQAMRWLRLNHKKGKLLVHFNEGSFALLAGYPDLKVSIDGRYEEVYPDSTVRLAFAALNPSASDFIPAFNSMRPDFVLLCQSSVPLQIVEFFPGVWRELYRDPSGNCAVFGDDSDTVFQSKPPQDLGTDSVWKLQF